jgi:adenylate cyclase
MALRTVYQRRSWQLPMIEWVRLYAGFSLPWLLIGHAVSTRIAVSLYGVHLSYRLVITNIIANGLSGWQLALLAPGWLHGCLGLWISLRRYDWALRAKPLLVGVVVLLPVLSALGFAEMSRAVEAAQAFAVPPSPAALARTATLLFWGRVLAAIYLAVIAATWLAGVVRNRLEAQAAVSD